MNILKKNESGQVTIEFIFSFAFAVLFLTFFLYFAYNYTIGYIAHYATYSASRAYLTYDEAHKTNALVYREAQAYAQEEFKKYKLKTFGVKSKKGLQFNNPGSGIRVYEFSGAHYSFSPPFVPSDENGDKMEFLSESFLGKEPTRSDCTCQILERMKGFSCDATGLADFPPDEITIYDNGC